MSFVHLCTFFRRISALFVKGREFLVLWFLTASLIFINSVIEIVGFTGICVEFSQSSLYYRAQSHSHSDYFASGDEQLRNVFGVYFVSLRIAHRQPLVEHWHR